MIARATRFLLVSTCMLAGTFAQYSVLASDETSWSPEDPKYREIIKILPEEKEPALVSEKGLKAFNQGVRLQKAGKYGLAAEKYSAAIDAGFDCFQSYYNLGVCRELEGKYEVAYKYLQQAYRLSNNYQPVCKHLIHVCLKLGKKDEARDLIHVLSQI
ncbi:MAG: tetratricopeptide repeat protein [Cyanobacteria bacterium HKST-UBA02]|nr:tetratricopeptide repeat protein [Cyanobacteria bacterium HKST-UBA02]